MKAAILTVGDELLNGQTVDTNASWLGKELNKIGVTVSTKLSVGDRRDAIIHGLDFAFETASLVIVTGGLGPTHDDITKKVIAEYFNDHLVFHQESYDQIVKYFDLSSRHPTESHRLQCYMPTKATLIKNKRGTAPGMWYHGERALLSMPGVPSEMKGIMEDEGLIKIASLNPGQHIRHYIIQTAGVGETYIAEQIKDLTDALPSGFTMAFLPGVASVKLRVSAIGSDSKIMNDRIKEVGSGIIKRLGKYVYATGETKLEEVIGNLAQTKGLKIGTAESCTGGLIARMITSRSGASRYFKGSIIAYANDVKEKVLGVSKETLDQHGAVSEATVIQMVAGLIRRLEIDIGVAVSGIAGPTGGTPQKPVGTIWIAVGDKNKTITQKLQLVKNRDMNIRYTSVVALNMLRLFLENKQ